MGPGFVVRSIVGTALGAVGVAVLFALLLIGASVTVVMNYHANNKSTAHCDVRRRLQGARCSITPQ